MKNNANVSHYAQLNDENVVIQVIVVDDSNAKNLSGEVDEEVGIQYCQNLLGGYWKRCSKDGDFYYRKNHPDKNYTYDAAHDAFIPPKPFASWVLNDKAQWEAPVAMPTDGKMYSWDEEQKQWAEVKA